MQITWYILIVSVNMTQNICFTRHQKIHICHLGFTNFDAKKLTFFVSIFDADKPIKHTFLTYFRFQNTLFKTRTQNQVYML